MEIIKKFFYLENKRWIIGSVIFAILLLLPIFTLFYKLIYIEGNSFNYLWENILFEYTFNTFYLIIITSFFSLLFGVIPAWFISNYRFKGRNFLDIALYLPLAIPSYIMAFTYSDILSYTGPIQSFLRKNFNDLSVIFNQDYLQIEVLGIILASVSYTHLTLPTKA